MLEKRKKTGTNENLSLVILIPSDTFYRRLKTPGTTVLQAHCTHLGWDSFTVRTLDNSKQESCMTPRKEKEH